MVQKNSNQKAGISHTHVTSRLRRLRTRTYDMSAQHTQPASGRGVSNFILTYVVHVRTAHEYARTSGI